MRLFTSSGSSESWSLSVDTQYGLVAVFLVVAVSMEDLFVGEGLAPTARDRNEVVDFEQIAITKVQSTAWARALLKRQQTA